MWYDISGNLGYHSRTIFCFKINLTMQIPFLCHVLFWLISVIHYNNFLDFFLNLLSILQVFIPITLYVKVYNMFDCVRRSTVKKFLSKQHRKIDYQSLALGNLQEVRHVFARIVFDTVYPLCPNQNQSLRSNCISQGG